MTPMMRRRESVFVDQMTAAIKGLNQVAGQPLHPLVIDGLPDPECDQVQLQFWLGARREASATYTFTFTSELSVSDNLVEFEDFVRDQSVVATQTPA